MLLTEHGHSLGESQDLAKTLSDGIGRTAPSSTRSCGPEILRLAFAAQARDRSRPRVHG